MGHKMSPNASISGDDEVHHDEHSVQTRGVSRGVTWRGITQGIAGPQNSVKVHSSSTSGQYQALATVSIHHHLAPRAPFAAGQ